MPLSLFLGICTWWRNSFMFSDAGLTTTFCCAERSPTTGVVFPKKMSKYILLSGYTQTYSCSVAPEEANNSLNSVTHIVPRP